MQGLSCLVLQQSHVFISKSNLSVPLCIKLPGFNHKASTLVTFPKAPPLNTIAGFSFHPHSAGNCSAPQTALTRPRVLGTESSVFCQLPYAGLMSREHRTKLCFYFYTVPFLWGSFSLETSMQQDYRSKAVTKAGGRQGSRGAESSDRTFQVCCAPLTLPQSYTHTELSHKHQFPQELHYAVNSLSPSFIPRGSPLSFSALRLC